MIGCIEAGCMSYTHCTRFYVRFLFFFFILYLLYLYTSFLLHFTLLISLQFALLWFRDTLVFTSFFDITVLLILICNYWTVQYCFSCGVVCWCWHCTACDFFFVPFKFYLSILFTKHWGYETENLNVVFKNIEFILWYLFLDFKMCVYIVYNKEFLFKLVIMYVFRHYKI